MTLDELQGRLFDRRSGEKELFEEGTDREEYNREQAARLTERPTQTRAVYNEALDKYFVVTDTVLPDSGVITVFRDVTDEKQQERERDRMRQAIDQHDDAMLVWDDNDSLVAFNTTAQNWNDQDTGIQLRIGMTLDDLMREFYENLEHQHAGNKESLKRAVRGLEKEDYIRAEVEKHKTNRGVANEFHNPIQDKYFEYDKEIYENIHNLKKKIHNQNNLKDLQKITNVPIITGFGIKSSEHIKAFKDYTDGIVIGSALIECLANSNPIKSMKDFLAPILEELKNE